MENPSDAKWKKELNQLLVGSMVYPNNADYSTIGCYYSTKAPKYLYKYYTDNERNVETVFNNKMWYSSPVCFNDPYDCDFAIDENATINTLLSSCFARDNTMKRGSLAWKAAYIDVKKNFPSFIKEINSIKSSIGVACLSENYDTVLMWSHYANDHKGMCIEYDLMDFNRTLGFTPIPVIYSKKRNVLRKLRANSLDQDIMDFFIKSLVCKEDSWKYENEWRIVRDDKACGNQWNNEKHGALLDSIRPASVILGYNAEPQFEDVIITRCKYEGVPAFKMEKETDNYTMKKVEL